jgi:hypothetical protein
MRPQIRYGGPDCGSAQGTSGCDPGLGPIVVNATRIYPDLPTVPVLPGGPGGILAFAPPGFRSPHGPGAVPRPPAPVGRVTPTTTPTTPPPAPPRKGLPGYQPVYGPENLPSDVSAPPTELAPELEQAAKNLVWQEITQFTGRLLGGIFDIATLALYSAPLGPSAPQEAALVAQTIASAEPNPFYNPDLQTDPFMEVAPYVSPSLSPDTSGLPVPGADIGIRPITVTATRLSPSTAPIGLPNLTTLPGSIYAPGIRTTPAASTGVRTFPTVFSPTTVAPKPGLGLGRVINPSRAPATSSSPFLRFPALSPPVEAPPTDIPSGGTHATANDCGASKSGQNKQKKKRKPRNVCHKGTYYERANGLIKFKQEQIPCR